MSGRALLTSARGVATFETLGFHLAFDKVSTNMVFVDMPERASPALVRALRAEGVIVNPPRVRRLRFVTHHDVRAADIEEAGRRIARAIPAEERS